MYTEINFKTKKELLAALAAGKEVRVFSPGPFPCPQDGRISLEGPHYPQAHKWYAEAEVRHGRVVKAK